CATHTNATSRMKTVNRFAIRRLQLVPSPPVSGVYSSFLKRPSFRVFVFSWLHLGSTNQQNRPLKIDLRGDLGKSCGQDTGRRQPRPIEHERLVVRLRGVGVQQVIEIEA